MRLWSLSPELLDSKGLVACWRESLLALHVLQGNTVGYKNHPQLDRFKKSDNPVQSISSYLWSLYWESLERGYKFDKNKIPLEFSEVSIPVTIGQLEYEYEFLKNKVIGRTGKWNHGFANILLATNFYVFYGVDGDVEYWEKIKQN